MHVLFWKLAIPKCSLNLFLKILWKIQRKNWSFEKYLECYILYVEGVLNVLLITVSLTSYFFLVLFIVSTIQYVHAIIRCLTF